MLTLKDNFYLSNQTIKNSAKLFDLKFFLKYIFTKNTQNITKLYANIIK